MAVTTIPSRTYQVGTNTVGPANVATGLTSVVLSFSRDQWLDPAVKLAARFEISLDNGVTWSPDPSGQAVWPWGVFPVTFTADGGVIGQPGGGTLAASSVSMALPDPTNPNRKLRAIATVSGGPLTTTITITTA